MKILVTGGGGFLGRAVVSGLLDRGYAVRTINRGSYPELESLGAECIRGDVGDSESVMHAADGVDGIIHVAARAGPGLWYDDFYRANVLGTRHVLEACQVHGIGYLVHTSSPSVVHGGGDLENADESEPYPDHFSAPYPETKAEAERLVLRANGEALRSCALRPHLIWGPGDNQLLPRLVEKARAGRLRLPAPDKKIDITYIDNAAAAHLLALEDLLGPGRSAGKAYFISDGQPRPVGEVLSAWLEAAGTDARLGRVHPRVAMAVATVVEGLWRLTRRRSDPPVSRFVVEHLATAHWYNLAAARRDLGYDPKVDFEEGIRRLRASWTD